MIILWKYENNTVLKNIIKIGQEVLKKNTLKILQTILQNTKKKFYKIINIIYYQIYYQNAN